MRVNTPLTTGDVVRFALGIVWALLSGVGFAPAGSDYISAYGLAASTGIVLTALAISYIWKGRKKNWRDMSIVFVIVCLVSPVVRLVIIRAARIAL